MNGDLIDNVLCMEMPAPHQTDAFVFDSCRQQKLLDVTDPLLCSDISHQKPAGALRTRQNQHKVRPSGKKVQNVRDVHLAGTRHCNEMNRPVVYIVLYGFRFDGGQSSPAAIENDNPWRRCVMHGSPISFRKTVNLL